MTQTRTVIMLWVLAVLLMGGTATHINATVGENVLLPCDCSETTYRVVWQDGLIVVNYFSSAGRKYNINDSYKTRSLLFLSSEKGNCTLLLLQVSFADQRNLTCYTFDNNGFQQTEVSLIITERLQYTPTEAPPIDLPTPNDTSEHRGDGEKEEQAKIPAGIPALLVVLLLVAGAVIMVLVLRKRHQDIQERVVVVDLQAGVPMMKNCPV